MWGAGVGPSSADEEVSVVPPTGGTMSWGWYSGSRKVPIGLFGHDISWPQDLLSSISWIDLLPFINSCSSMSSNVCP